MSSGIYGKRPDVAYDPGENVPDGVAVPDRTVWILTEDPVFNALPGELIEDLRGKKERDWFTEHFYFCLPITFGNQHGFVVKADRDFICEWNGGGEISDLVVSVEESDRQFVTSHFGSGIITIQNRWTFRTGKGVNLLVMPPPNFFIDGIMCMTAVVETDWLRRDFTFNLKMTRAGRVEVRAGTPVGCVLPYPRGFFDGYKLELMPEGEELEGERKTVGHYAVSRTNYEAGLPGHKYMKGIDIYGNKFSEHQKVIRKV